MKKLTALLTLVLILSLTLISCIDEGNISDDQTDGTTLADASTPPAADTTTAYDTTTESQEGLLSLNIGSYNIANGKLVSHDIKVIANDILSKDLDIVGLQEVDKFAKRSKYIDTMALLSEYTGYNYYYYTVAINIAGNEAVYGQKGEYGTGILSKYPILEAKSIKLESGGNEQRMLGYAKIDVNGQIINFYNTHLSYEDFSIRTGQFETIASLLKDKEYCILTGDFNIAGFGEFKSIPFLNTTCNANNWLTTFPSNSSSIDNILFSNEFTLGQSKVLAQGHSDHNMLYATLKYRSK